MFKDAHFINIGFDPEVAYNDLPLLPPSVGGAIGGLESVEVLKACIPARAGLAELNQICRYFPRPDVLWRIFPLVEAHASGQIEKKLVDLDVLFRYPLPLSDETSTDIDASVAQTAPQAASQASKTSAGQNKPVTPDDTSIERVLRIRDTLVAGYALSRDRRIDSSVLLELCSTLENRPMSIRRGGGIGVEKNKNREQGYKPPVGVETLQHLLLNWEEFIHVEAGTLDPLVLIALAHYQLVAIEPFQSSSETLTRIVDYLLLADEQLLAMPVLNLSDWYHINREEALRLQTAVTEEQQWQEWVLFFLKGVHTATQKTIGTVNAIADLLEVTDKYLQETMPKIHSDALLEVIFSEPCVRIQNLVGRGIARRQTASVYLKQLCERDVLREIPFGKEKLFVNHRLLKLIGEKSNQFDPYPQ